jgi:hypothetical protein
VLGDPAYHLLGFYADSEYAARESIDSYDGRLIQHYALALYVHEGIGRTEIYTYVFASDAEHTLPLFSFRISYGLIARTSRFTSDCRA